MKDDTRINIGKLNVLVSVLISDNSINFNKPVKK